ncbi:hypothetical protein SRB5_16110 [Streptomyces sp. RB5]|uniref:Uncharacterized protein n=2 Tax=Streptomyces smaragdinus TaxID=2585196 RepID=A0A7K0CEM1_9ACTN|nr:hypothetical protein [Streptomyces smaragdinus]
MRTKCMSCKKSQYVIREMSPFPIFDDERERRAEHAYHKTCPNCGNFWDPLILEPLGPVED